jgi:hypothetical protein
MILSTFLVWKICIFHMTIISSSFLFVYKAYCSWGYFSNLIIDSELFSIQSFEKNISINHQLYYPNTLHQDPYKNLFSFFYYFQIVLYMSPRPYELCSNESLAMVWRRDATAKTAVFVGAHVTVLVLNLLRQNSIEAIVFVLPVAMKTSQNNIFLRFI